MCLLREMFGPGVAKLRVEHKPWKIELPTRKLEVELTTVSSNYHIELNPSDVGNNDRYVVQEIIKEMAKTKNVDPSGARTFKASGRGCARGMPPLRGECRPLGSFHAAAGAGAGRRGQPDARGAARAAADDGEVLRGLPDHHAVQQPVPGPRARPVSVPLRPCARPVPGRSSEGDGRGRCHHDCIACRRPTPCVRRTRLFTTAQVLLHVAAEERLHLPAKLAARVAFASQRNLRKALLALEACKAHQYPFTEVTRGGHVGAAAEGTGLHTVA